MNRFLSSLRQVNSLPLRVFPEVFPDVFPDVPPHVSPGVISAGILGTVQGFRKVYLVLGWKSLPFGASISTKTTFTKTPGNIG